VHVVALGGAALLAAFPPLARPPIKLAWTLATLLLYGAALRVWQSYHPGAPLSEWWERSPAYVPAAIAVVIGLLLPPRSGVTQTTDEHG
jgi:hypothetical protein